MTNYGIRTCPLWLKFCFGVLTAAWDNVAGRLSSVRNGANTRDAERLPDPRLQDVKWALTVAERTFIECKGSIIETDKQGGAACSLQETVATGTRQREFTKPIAAIKVSNRHF